MTLQPETRDTEPASADRSGLNRRTVLKAGAHAAWAIPAVQVITQAPALAAVSGTLSASGTGQWVTVSTGRNQTTTYIDTTITVFNASHQQTDGLAVQAIFPKGWSPSLRNQPSGWTAVSSPKTNTTGVTWTFTASSQDPANQPATFNAQFTPSNSSNKNAAVEITLHPISGNQASVDGTFAVPAG